MGHLYLAAIRDEACRHCWHQRHREDCQCTKHVPYRTYCCKCDSLTDLDLRSAIAETERGEAAGRSAAEAAP